MLTDDYLMRSYQLTPEYRPLVDHHADLAPVQGNKGWRFGYSDALVDSTADFRPLKYFAHSSGQLPDGRWAVGEVGSFANPPCAFMCIRAAPMCILRFLTAMLLLRAVALHASVLSVGLPAHSEGQNYAG